MNQIKEGTLLFNNVPSLAADVQIFPFMPDSLINADKFVKTGHTGILDDPLALLINKLTNRVVMKAHFYLSTSTWNDIPDGPKGPKKSYTL